MTRTIPMICIASFLFGAAGCRRRPSARKVIQMDEPVATLPASPTDTPQPRRHALQAPAPVRQETEDSDTPPPPGQKAAKPAAPAPAPSVAQPYSQPTPTGGRVPMWKQRAKFY